MALKSTDSRGKKGQKSKFYVTPSSPIRSFFSATVLFNLIPSRVRGSWNKIGLKSRPDPPPINPILTGKWPIFKHFPDDDVNVPCKKCVGICFKNRLNKYKEHVSPLFVFVLVFMNHVIVLMKSPCKNVHYKEFGTRNISKY